MTEFPRTDGSVTTEATRPTRWWSVWAVAAGSFALVMSEFLAIGVLPDVATSMRVTEGTAGLMVTAPGLMAALAAPLLTVAAAKVDRRTVLLAFTVLLIVSNVLAAAAPAFWVLLLARLLLGIAVGGFWTIGVSIAPRLVPARSVAHATAVISFGITLATIASLPLGALAGNYIGWRAGFVIIAGISVLALAFQFTTLKRLPAQHTVTFTSLVTVLRIPRARAGVIGTALVVLGHFAGFTYLVPTIQDLAGFTDAWTPSVLLVFGVAGVLGNFTAGSLATRYGVPTLITAALFLLTAAVGLFPILGHTKPAVVALVSLWGLAWGGVPVGLQLWALESTGDRADAGLALTISTSQLALAAGAYVGGVIVDDRGIPAALATAAVAVGASMLTFRRGDKHPARSDPTIAGAGP